MNFKKLNKLVDLRSDLALNVSFGDWPYLSKLVAFHGACPLFFGEW